MKTTQEVIKLKLDCAELRQFVDAVSNLDDAAIADSGPDSIHSILLSFLDTPEKFLCLDSYTLPAAGTDVVFVRVKPSETFRSRVLAGRARE